MRNDWSVRSELSIWYSRGPGITHHYRWWLTGAVALFTPHSHLVTQSLCSWCWSLEGSVAVCTLTLYHHQWALCLISKWCVLDPDDDCLDVNIFSTMFPGTDVAMYIPAWLYCLAVSLWHHNTQSQLPFLESALLMSCGCCHSVTSWWLYILVIVSWDGVAN